VTAALARSQGSACALHEMQDLHQPVPSALRTAADAWLHACATHPNYCGCLLVYLQASMLCISMLRCKLRLLVGAPGSGLLRQLAAIAAWPWVLQLQLQHSLQHMQLHSHLQRASASPDLDSA
jgi:hypothetical protein